MKGIFGLEVSLRGTKQHETYKGCFKIVVASEMRPYLKNSMKTGVGEWIPES